MNEVIEISVIGLSPDVMSGDNFCKDKYFSIILRKLTCLFLDSNTFDWIFREFRLHYAATRHRQTNLLNNP